MKIIPWLCLGLWLNGLFPLAVVAEDKSALEAELQKKAKDLIYQVEKGDWLERKAALKALEEIGEPAEPLLKESAKNPDPQINKWFYFILKVIELKKRVKFAVAFLSKFPDIYWNLVQLDTKEKFKLLQEVTILRKNDIDTYEYSQRVLTKDLSTFKYSMEVTNKDLSLLIGEILSVGSSELTAQQKQVIIAMIGGRDYFCTDDALVKKRMGGWHSLLPELAPHLIKLLKDSDVPVRADAAKTIGTLHLKEAVPDLMEVLRNDNETDVIIGAVCSLSNLNVRESIPEITKLLYHKNHSVQINSLHSLSVLNAKEAVPDIIKLLNESDKNKTWNIFIRKHIVRALGELNTKESISALNSLTKDEDKIIRVEAIRSLGKLGDKNAIPELIKRMKDEDEKSDMCYYAILALGEIGAKEAIPEIVKLMDNKNVMKRCCAAIALLDLGAKQEIAEPTKIAENIKMLRSSSVFDWYDDKRILTIIKQLEENDK